MSNLSIPNSLGESNQSKRNFQRIKTDFFIEISVFFLRISYTFSNRQPKRKIKLLNENIMESITKKKARKEIKNQIDLNILALKAHCTFWNLSKDFVIETPNFDKIQIKSVFVPGKGFVEVV